MALPYGFQFSGTSLLPLTDSARDALALFEELDAESDNERLVHASSLERQHSTMTRKNDVNDFHRADESVSRRLDSPYVPIATSTSSARRQSGLDGQTNHLSRSTTIASTSKKPNRPLATSPGHPASARSNTSSIQGKDSRLSAPSQKQTCNYKESITRANESVKGGPRSRYNAPQPALQYDIHHQFPRGDKRTASTSSSLYRALKDDVKTISSSRTPSLANRPVEGPDLSELPPSFQPVEGIAPTSRRGAGRSLTQAAKVWTRSKVQGPPNDADLPSMLVPNAHTASLNDVKQAHQPRKKKTSPRSGTVSRKMPTRTTKSKQKVPEGDSFIQKNKDQSTNHAETNISISQPASAFVASLPKRKYVSGKPAPRTSATTALMDGSSPSPTRSEHHRENWEVSGSSDGENGDETDYDDVSVLPSKQPPLKRASSNKPAMMQTRTKRQKSMRASPMLDGPEDQEKGEDTEIPFDEETARRNQENRKSYFAEVDDFAMDVELVL